MTISYELDRELGVFELRELFLEHTRQAWNLLPTFETGPPRILDIGCGTGIPLLELARLSRGDVVGIDVDEVALSVLRQRAADADLEDQVTARCVSLFEAGFPDSDFDLLWEEGVLHLLETESSLGECRRLLKPGCHLVMHETNVWLAKVREPLASLGFTIRAEHPLPPRHWLTAYAEPLDARLHAYMRSHNIDGLDDVTNAALATHQAAVASIRADPDVTDCTFCIVQKMG